MITITKSRFARRSLVLCGLAGAAVIWLMLSLVNLQLVSPRKTSGVSSGGIIEREVLLPQRGRARPQKGNKQQREKQLCAHQPVPLSKPDFTIIIIFYRFGNCRISRPKNCSVWQACASRRRERMRSV